MDNLCFIQRAENMELERVGLCNDDLDCRNLLNALINLYDQKDSSWKIDGVQSFCVDKSFDKYVAHSFFVT